MQSLVQSLQRPRYYKSSSEFRVQSSEFRVQSSEFRVQSSENKFLIKFAYLFPKIILLLFFSFSFSLFAESRKPTLAVLNFKSDAGLTSGQLNSISEQAASGLSAQGKYTIIDRNSKKEVIDEIAAQQTGIYDEVKTANASKSLGAEKILIGSVTRFGDNYVLTAKIVDVNTTKIDSSQKKEVASIGQISQGIESLVKKFGKEPVTKMRMLWRSVVLPGWGQLHSGLVDDDSLERVKGFAFMGGALLLGVGLYAADSSYQAAKSDYSSKKSIDTLVFLSTPNTFNPLQLITYSLANNAGSRMDNAANNAKATSVFLVGLYFINILDVVLFGGHDAVAKTILLENPYAKTEGFRFHMSTYTQNGVGSREMYVKYDFIF